MTGIYIHIPFCEKKCGYCDFLSFPGEQEMQKRYVEVLCRQIRESEFSGQFADSVFVGGGTPSLLEAEDMEKILKAIYETFRLSSDCEISLESNPKTLSDEKLSSYISMGMNRLSMGVQSMNDQFLARLGRIHKTEDVIRNYEQARKAGFRNVNFDLMFALPGQTLIDWENDIKKAVELEPEHISFYSLTVEEGTPFYIEKQMGTLLETDDDLDRNMYHLALKLLRDFGYQQYEISNAAKTGFACRHNLKYWSMENYLGFGLGAHSFFEGRRFSTEENLGEYLNNPKKLGWSHLVSEREMMEEFVFLGLRKTVGVKIDKFESKFGRRIIEVYENQIEKMTKEELLIEDKGFLKLTTKGTDLSNYVMAEFIE